MTTIWLFIPITSLLWNQKYGRFWLHIDSKKMEFVGVQCPYTCAMICPVRDSGSVLFHIIYTWLVSHSICTSRDNNFVSVTNEIRGRTLEEDKKIRKWNLRLMYYFFLWRVKSMFSFFFIKQRLVNNLPFKSIGTLNPRSPTIAFHHWIIHTSCWKFTACDGWVLI